MNSQQYNQLLTESGAYFDKGTLYHFGNIEQELQHANDQPFITSLVSQLSALSVQGEDANTFLQGQFSNDISLVNSDNSQISSYSSAKGRLLAIFRVFQHQKERHISVQSELTEAFSKRLTMFILRSKVSIQNSSKQIAVIGLGGNGINSSLHTFFPEIPERDHQVTSNGEITLIKIPGTTIPRYELYGNYSAISDVWKKLSTTLKPVTPASWRRHDIQAAIPKIYPQTSEAFVAQMVNLDLINGINFKKGCYPGQEVIARLHYRGQSKRRMYPIHIQTNKTLAPGTAIYRLNKDKYQSIGEIVESVRISEQALEALAVLQIEHIDLKQCYFKSDQSSYSEAQFEIPELPYPIPSS